MSDVYYSPGKYNLETVGEIEWEDEPYQFDLTVVWRRKDDGQLLYASDSGCSCPTPFEDHGIGDLTEATAHEISEILINRARVKSDNVKWVNGDWDFSEVDDISDEHAMKISELMGRLV